MIAALDLPPRASLSLRWVAAQRTTRELLDKLATDPAWNTEQIAVVARDAVHGCNVVREALLEGGRATAKRDAEIERRLVATEKAVERLERATLGLTPTTAK